MYIYFIIIIFQLTIITNYFKSEGRRVFHFFSCLCNSQVSVYKIKWHLISILLVITNKKLLNIYAIKACTTISLNWNNNHNSLNFLIRVLKLYSVKVKAYSSIEFRFNHLLFDLFVMSCLLIIFYLKYIVT